MEMLSVTLILLVSVIILFYKWLTANYDYFDKKGLKSMKPLQFKFKNLSWPRSYSLPEVLVNIYNEFPDEKIMGTFQIRRPIYVVTNVETAKKVMIKDFAHFQDHNDTVNEDFDEIFSNSLAAMKGKRWREMRISLTPAFTGSKMRLMLQFINKCCEQLVNHISDELQISEAFKAKDNFAKYTTDVIATCAFGVECNSFKDPNNEIYKIGRELVDFQRPLKILKLFTVFLFPKISKFFGLKAFDTQKKKRFREIIIETMETREKNGIVRPDMINILMELKKANPSENEAEGKRTWNEMELIAQCFTFFLAGSDPSSTLMSYTAHELGVNPDIQEKLIQEVDETYESLNGSPLTYEALQKMKYLHMIITEVLRKWPPAPVGDRLCVEDYNYEDELGRKFTVEKGSLMWIPIYAIHRDPKIYPEPDTFDPERFAEENNPNFDPFLAFGAGPRNCIGLRFALMETKAVFYHILLNYKIIVGKETQVPLKLKKTLLGMFPEKPITVYFERREVKQN